MGVRQSHRSGKGYGGQGGDKVREVREIRSWETVRSGAWYLIDKEWRRLLRVAPRSIA